MKPSSLEGFGPVGSNGVSQDDARVVGWLIDCPNGVLPRLGAPVKWMTFESTKAAYWAYPTRSRIVTPLVPLSLLAEAESRAQYWKGERQAGNAVINDLRARLDAVLSVVTALERVPRGKYPRAAKIIVDLRSAALGGESRGNEEVVR